MSSSRVPITSRTMSMEPLLVRVIIYASQRLGYTSVRPMQLQATRSCIVECNDVVDPLYLLACLLDRESHCFIPVMLQVYGVLTSSFIAEGRIVVAVSPLIALMKDQVAEK